MPVVVLSGFILALVTPWIVRVLRGWSGWAIALLPLTLTLYFLGHMNGIASGDVLLQRHTWVSSLNVNLSFSLDGLSLLFSLLITGIGAIVFIYSGTYLKDHPEFGRFLSYLLMFMGSMLGVVLADNLITLFVFWELTSLSSYLLIGFYHGKDSSRNAALQALLVTGAGGLTMLAGFLLLGQMGGSLEISTLLGKGESIQVAAMYPYALILILLGAFTKSAQIPFHFWLPSAMEAPTPVSTYLHSATMVKAGVYLLARLSPILGGTELWVEILVPVGALTMVAGAWLALLHTDLKLILAYTTVSALGMLVMLLGIGTDTAVLAAMVLLLAHALYKGALFLVVGILDHETGTRDALRLGGLLRPMPVTAVAGGLAALSSAGVPPFFGFISKELTYEAALGIPSNYLTAMVLFASAAFVTAGCIVGLGPFWGRKDDYDKEPHDAPFSLWLGPLLLGLKGLSIGLFPGFVAGVLIAPAVTAVTMRSTSVDLALWHGFNPSLLLSGFALLVGIVIFLAWDGFRRVASRMDHSRKWGPARWYGFSLEALDRMAGFITGLLQSGHLHVYLLMVIVAATGLIGASLFGHRLPLYIARWSDVRLYELLLAGIILIATLIIVRTQSRLTAIVSLGVVGYGVAILFLLFSAPDLAMTQFCIETLSVVLLVLVLFRLPSFKRYSGTTDRVRDAITALAAGGIMIALVLSATSLSREPPLLPYYLKNSLLLAKGRNIVNVILVDFRGLDTMGEITVLSVAAIGVYSLLKLRQSEKDTENQEERG